LTQDYQHLEADITCIETHYQRPGLACCYLLQAGDTAALIDTGTSYTTPYILNLLKRRGIARDKVRYIIPTHVHLDHAGGTGQLMAALPEAELVVHPFGARHLINPEKLQAGTIAVYGEDEFKREYGELMPVAADRVIEASDGLTIDLNGRSLICLDTPGHARHHICIWDEQSQGFFTGDTFGIAYPELETDKGPFMLLPSTPVQFDPDTWHRTLARLLGWQPKRMYLTHYGEVQQPQALVETLHREVDAYVQIAQASHSDERPRDRLEEGLWEHCLQRLATHGCKLSRGEIKRLLEMDIGLCAQGLEVWLQRNR